MISGKCNVHLTGYLDPEFEDEQSEDEEEVEEEEEETSAPINNKRKLENNTNATASKKAKVPYNNTNKYLKRYPLLSTII